MGREEAFFACDGGEGVFLGLKAPFSQLTSTLVGWLLGGLPITIPSTCRGAGRDREETSICLG